MSQHVISCAVISLSLVINSISWLFRFVMLYVMVMVTVMLVKMVVVVFIVKVFVKDIIDLASVE